MAVDNNILAYLVVNEPGTSSPISANFVKEALILTIREDNQTTVTKSYFALVNVSINSEEQLDNAISVRLENMQASQVSTLKINRVCKK